MNKFSNRLTDCRSRLLDAEANLNFMRNRENLNTLLEHDSPDVVVGAMIDQAWDLVSDASGDCEAMAEMSNEDLGAELQETAKIIVEAGFRDQASTEVGQQDDGRKEKMEQVDEIHTQTDSLLSMLLLYLDQARNGGDTFNEHVLCNYVWQLQSNVRRAQEISDTLFRSLR